MTLLYIDTNIFIDAIKNRQNTLGKDIAEPAAKMFFEAISCKFYLAISTWALEQVYLNVSIEETKMLLKMIEKKIKLVKYDDADKKKANELAPDNFEDAMHVVLAEKSKADFIITRDVHFLKIDTNIPIRRPENVL
jgi:predicted nucleic acid-binding protein